MKKNKIQSNEKEFAAGQFQERLEKLVTSTGGNVHKFRNMPKKVQVAYLQEFNISQNLMDSVLRCKKRKNPDDSQIRYNIRFINAVMQSGFGDGEWLRNSEFLTYIQTELNKRKNDV